MLQIASLLIRNFKSYGDYDTTLDIVGLKTCLVCGVIQGNSKRKNGAGKSTLLEAIIWCLFGKTSKKSNPGDSVVNRLNGTGCVVQLTLKNGDIIKRTRMVGGHGELIYIKNNNDESLGTVKMQQEALEKELGINYDLFCKSVFMGQKSKKLVRFV